MIDSKQFLLFSGSSHIQLARKIAENLGVSLADVDIKQFPDGEIGVRIKENVRGRDVYVVQSIAINPNFYLMELLILIDALKRASAKEIVAVIPYYGYARQDRKDSGRVPITAKLVANLLEKAGATRVVTIDLHADQVQGFFDIPVENVYARRLFVEKIGIDSLQDWVSVAPDIGSIRLARQFAQEVNTPIAIVDKHRINSYAVQSHALIGSVHGKNVILIDDICSTGNTLKAAAYVCRHFGAKKVVAAVSHALFTTTFVEESGLDELWVTDSIPNPATLHHTVTTVSIGKLFAEVIRSILEDGSVSSLFSD